MTRLIKWALRHGIGIAAVEDLRAMLGEGHANDTPGTSNPVTEAGIMAAVRLEASRKGMRLWRNNVGATYDSNGRFIRFGLANDSQQMNNSIKSGDLIGIRPIVITEDMIGQTVGQFVSREVKRAGWVYSGTQREVAQRAWLDLVTSMGGDAAFVTREGDL